MCCPLWRWLIWFTANLQESIETFSSSSSSSSSCTCAHFARLIAERANFQTGRIRAFDRLPAKRVNCPCSTSSGHPNASSRPPLAGSLLLVAAGLVCGRSKPRQEDSNMLSCHRQFNLSRLVAVADEQNGSNQSESSQCLSLNWPHKIENRLEFLTLLLLLSFTCLGIKSEPKLSSLPLLDM